MQYTHVVIGWAYNPRCTGRQPRSARLPRGELPRRYAEKYRTKRRGKRFFEETTDAVNRILSVARIAKTEEEVYEFLAGHEEIWRAALPRSRRVVSKCSLHRFVPDFAVGQLNTTMRQWSWTLIEIESPSDLLFTKRNDPSAKLVHAVKQVAHW